MTDVHAIVPETPAWESLCHRCGKCCHLAGSPCEHLRKSSDGTFACSIYATRHGRHKTLAGVEFDCVPYEQYLKLLEAPEGCGYTEWQQRNIRQVYTVEQVRGIP